MKAGTMETGRRLAQLMSTASEGTTGLRSGEGTDGRGSVERGSVERGSVGRLKAGRAISEQI